VGSDGTPPMDAPSFPQSWKPEAEIQAQVLQRLRIAG
jgi:putative NADH-flavin reductase